MGNQLSSLLPSGAWSPPHLATLLPDKAWSPPRLGAVDRETVRSACGMLAVASALVATYKVGRLLWKRRQDRQMLAKHYPGPPPDWLFGNMAQMMSLPGKMLQGNIEYTRQYGDAWPMWITPFWFILKMCGPDTIQAISATAEPKDPVGYRFILDWIGDGLLLSSGRKWARNRRLLTPAFHFDILRPYVTTFSDSADIMVKKWSRLCYESKSDTVQLEMFENVSLMTLDSLMKCIFGVSENIQNQGERNPYIKSVYEMADLINQRFRFFPYHSEIIYYFSPQGFRFRRACNQAHKFTRSVIDKKIKQKEMEDGREEKKYVDFIDMLLDCRDEDGRGLPYQEICDEVDTFMFEGHDTTASGISWFLYNLARHPEYQQKCREEINQVLGDKASVEWSDLPHLQYLAQCLKESLRLHPPVPNIGRQITKPLNLPDGRTAPAGTCVGIGIYACHHNDRVWPNPELYDPERFSPENSQGRHPHAFVPFSAGPRNCIGQHFALNEMKVCVAQVLRHFQLSVDEARIPQEQPELVLRSKNGVWLNVTRV